jgi:hypothetical protein
MHVLAGMLMIGLLCNLLIRPVDSKHHMSEEQIARERMLAREVDAASGPRAHEAASTGASRSIVLAAAWIAIAIPLGWGVWITLSKSLALFR